MYAKLHLAASSRGLTHVHNHLSKPGTWSVLDGITISSLLEKDCMPAVGVSQSKLDTEPGAYAQLQEMKSSKRFNEMMNSKLVYGGNAILVHRPPCGKRWLTGETDSAEAPWAGKNEIEFIL